MRKYIEKVWTASGTFNYGPNNDYTFENIASPGSLCKTCDKCDVTKWDMRSLGMSCSNGKVHLPVIDSEKFTINLHLSTTSKSKHFSNIQTYNRVFQIQSLKGKILREISNLIRNLECKVKIYHRIISL